MPIPARPSEDESEGGWLFISGNSELGRDISLVWSNATGVHLLLTIPMLR